MIRVSQGHENGIGIELFLKCISLLSQEKIDNFRCYFSKKSLLKLESELDTNILFDEDSFIIFGKIVKNTFLKEIKSTESSASLELALADTNSGDILFTLPTTKSELYLNSALPCGHTEYLRAFYQKESLTMFFTNGMYQYLLLTDHVPLKEVPNIISEHYILEKLEASINSFQKINLNPINIIFSGINPHAGEEGKLGNEDYTIINAIIKLTKKYPQFNFKGPLPGDTIHLNAKKENILVYSFHDQALSSFKTKNKFYGLNITLGLPFLRVSPDFGTAFDLRGTNKANYIGLLSTINNILDNYDY